MYRDIEIEFRAMFSKSVYDRLLRSLHRCGKYLGADDKDVHFYIYPGRLYKVVDNTSTRTAEIVLKKNRIGRGSHFEEVEIPISRADVPKAVELFNTFNAPHTDHESQTRHNFLWRRVHIAVKQSKTWGYHAEFEIMIHDRRNQSTAEKQIQTVAKALNVQLMTDADLRAFLHRVDRGRQSNRRRTSR